MKRVYVNEQWCLGCRLCEYYCAFANSNESDIVKALKDKKIHSNIRVETKGNINFAVSCRHCEEPLCVKGCITGALQKKDGLIVVDKDRCIHCYTCIVCCPYGAVSPSADGVIQKCELCAKISGNQPACVKGCINQAIVYEER
ncbi:MAG: 4Fe-4S ferredoxin [Christensenellaceae bacterium]|jgi:carbon-monoxide dehydrogenase iron sulfur subunit|nr:4Fe-4S ferredoxin [Christensenellaceae bacterium]